MKIIKIIDYTFLEHFFSALDLYCSCSDTLFIIPFLLYLRVASHLPSYNRPLAGVISPFLQRLRVPVRQLIYSRPWVGVGLPFVQCSCHLASVPS